MQEMTVGLADAQESIGGKQQNAEEPEDVSGPVDIT